MAVLAALDRRDRVPELMDGPGLDPAEHRAALAALARINRLSLSAEFLWPSIARLAREIPGRPVRVLDVATGSGDVPRRLWHKAERVGIAVEIAGCDLSATAVEEASRGAESAGASLRFFRHDAVGDPLPDGF